MKNYNIGLDLSGKIEFAMIIRAENFRHAAYQWAFLTGHIDPCFDGEKLTYFGWKISEVKLKSSKKKSKN